MFHECRSESFIQLSRCLNRISPGSTAKHHKVEPESPSDRGMSGASAKSSESAEKAEASKVGFSESLHIAQFLNAFRSASGPFEKGNPTGQTQCGTASVSDALLFLSPQTFATARSLRGRKRD